MAQLAIKGHLTRGEEVIEILEMLGGKNDNLCYGGFFGRIYFINENGYIAGCDKMHKPDYLQLTLEEFLEKFPYKVGDKVLYKTYGIYSKIKTMLWNAEKERVFYRLESNKLFVAAADELQPRKEETMEEIIKIDIPKGYEFAGVDDDKQQVVFTKIGYHYPKTYKECCEVLKTTRIHIEGLGLDEVNRIKPFIQLLRCRNAYWKIAGEQMGLGEPWKPDWVKEGKKYCIFVEYNKIVTGAISFGNFFLAFPTEEMRDAFYENFKDLIEHCKEFL